MNFLEFRTKMFDLACISIDQVYAWQPGFNRNNIVRWVDKGLLIRLKQGYYTFPEYKEKQDFAFYFANRIYRPSYISLHTALSFYGLIPEAVIQITSVTPLKTASFSNTFAEYTYKSIKNELMFGYDLKPMSDGRVLHFARPEKALLDLIYLYPEYHTQQQMEDLRLDEDFLHEELNIEMINEYRQNFKNKALDHRVQILLNAYGL